LQFQPALALREHLLEGHRVSLLEALLVFGVQSLNAELGRLKRDGYKIADEKVSMAKIIRRINEVAKCQPPANLPFKEIVVTEYWISL
jgi:hypothetical protein